MLWCGLCLTCIKTPSPEVNSTPVSSHWAAQDCPQLRLCNSTRVFQASAHIFSCKAFFHFSQAHDYNLWQTGSSTGKLHQLRARELHLGSVRSESNVYCFIPWPSIWAGDCDGNGFHAKRLARFNTSNDQQKDAGQTLGDTWSEVSTFNIVQAEKQVSSVRCGILNYNP